MKRMAVWMFYGVGAVAIGYLALYAYAVFTGRDLQPGDYEARLEGRMSDWPAGRFDEIARLPLRIVPRN